MTRTPIVTWRDVLWLVHRFPLRWAVRVSPEPLLGPTERVAEWAFTLGRWYKRREAAQKMAAMLGISGAEAHTRAGSMLRHAVQMAHVERRLAESRALRAEPIRWVGREHLEAAMAAKKGVLVCVLHRFAVASLPRAMAAEGFQVLTVVREMTRPTFGRIVGRLARRSERTMYDFLYPDRVHPDDPNVTLKVAASLRAGGIVMIAGDALHSNTAVSVPFLGRETRFSVGVLELARLTGSPLLPCDPLYDDDGAVRLRFLPPLDVTAAATRDEFIDRNLPKLLAVFESFIVSCPEQWMRWAEL